MNFDLPGSLLPLLMILIAIFVVAILAGFAIRGQRARQQREASERGIRTLLSCRLCGGALEPCSLSTYRSTIVLRRGGRAEVIGAVRCRDCGHIDLFS